jgi:hypothetical protein
MDGLGRPSYEESLPDRKMTDLQLWIDRCRKRLNRGLALKVTAEWLAVWLCAFGTLLLVTKVAWPALWPRVLWLGLTVIPVVGLAVRRALRDRFTASDGSALLDRRLKANGLLMAVAEKPGDRWRDRLPREHVVWTAALPKLRPARFARVVVLPLAFAVVALLLPARRMPTSAAATRRTLPAMQELPEMLAELKRAQVLDADEAAFLQEEIGKLVESTANAPPTPETWRKIDALRARLNDRLDRETRTLEKGRQAARKLAQAGRNGVPPLTNEQRRQLEKDLADALKRTRQAKAAASKTGEKQPSPQSKTRKSQNPSIPPKTTAKTPGTGPGKESPIPPGKNPAANVPVARVSRGKAPAAKKSQSAALPKQLAKSGKKQPRQSGKKLPAFDPSLLRDLAKVARMVENLPPELQEKLKQEVMRMIQSGRLRIPDDPAVRDMLMKQARQMLERDGKRLEELRKRFGHLAGNLEQWKKLQPPETDSSSAGRQTGGKLPGHAAGKQPKAGSGKHAAGSVSFRDVVLPPGLLDKPRIDPDSVSGKRPSVSAFQPTVPDGPQATDDPAGEKWRALRRRVRPRNRKLVYKYFYGKDEK